MVTVKIRRFDADNPDDARWDSFQVPAQRTDRVLNLLHYIKWYLDGTLTFRRSCAHGVCGSDAVRINGVNRLACKVLMRDMLKAKGKTTTITIEPIRGLPVEKDLVVDMEPFFAAYRAVKPYLIASGNEPTSPPPTGHVSTTPPSASSAPPAPPRARCTGPTAATSDPRPSSTHTGSSSTAATRAPRSAWRFSTTRTACGAAAPRLTAPTPALAVSR